MREWIVTRPKAEARELVESLSSAGVSVRAIPCVERHFLDWPWPPPQHESGWVVVTSAAMAKRLGSIPSYIRVAALAPRTTEVFEARGTSVALTSSTGVEGLADALEAEWSREKRPKWFIHYPTSDLGLKDHEPTLALQVMERIATVRRYEAYRSVAPKELAAEAKTVGPETGMIFYSPSAISHWLETDPPKPAAVICHGATTIEWYELKRPRHWPKGVLATGEIPKTVVEMDRSAQ